MKKVMIIIILITMIFPSAYASQDDLYILAEETSRSNPAPVGQGVGVSVAAPEGHIYVMELNVKGTEVFGDNLAVVMSIRFGKVRYNPDAELILYPDAFQLVGKNGRVHKDVADAIDYADAEITDIFYNTISAYGETTINIKVIFEGCAEYKEESIVRYQDTIMGLLYKSKPEVLKLNTAWLSI